MGSGSSVGVGSGSGSGSTTGGCVGRLEVSNDSTVGMLVPMRFTCTCNVTFSSDDSAKRPS